MMGSQSLYSVYVEAQGVPFFNRITNPSYGIGVTNPSYGIRDYKSFLRNRITNPSYRLGLQIPVRNDEHKQA